MGGIRKKDGDKPPHKGQKEKRDEKSTNSRPPWRFWAILPALCATTFLSALDTSIISTALPTIAKDLNSEVLYIWTINSYLLTSTAVQPLYGQTANIFGRRWTTISAVVLFAVGSAIAGWAKDTATMIAGRSVQGIGGGGINALVEIVICDLVPMRERGKYVGMMGSMWALGSVVGPVLGGALAQHSSWRWIFWINLPLSGISLVLLSLFLRLNYPRSDIWKKLRRVDYTGNAILVTAITSILLALTWAGTKHPWKSWRTIVPLISGGLGLPVFQFHQSSRFCKEPTMPTRLFSNRTSFCAYGLIFVQSILLYWVCYFLPVYFQAVKGHTATQSGIDLLPISVTTAPAGILTGIGVAVTGHYRAFHFFGFALMTVSVGLLSILDLNSPTGQWIGFQMLFGAGGGVIFSSTLPAVQASLSESDVATATATWAFMRSFGAIWGTSVPSAIFNYKVDQLLHLLDNAKVASLMSNGGAYALASQNLVQSLRSDSTELANTVLYIYDQSLRLVWEVAIAFGVFGFLLAFPVKGLSLRKELDTEYGLGEQEKEKAVRISQIYGVHLAPRQGHQDLRRLCDSCDCLWEWDVENSAATSLQSLAPVHTHPRF